MSAVLNLLRKTHQFLEPTPPQNFAFSNLENGLPKGAIVEISGTAGSGKTEAVLRFLAENPEARVAWVEESFTVYPSAFPRNRVGLERVLFVESPPGETLWTFQQLVRSQIFGVIVLQWKAGQVAEETVLRRLQLAAEKAQVTVILLSETPAKKGTWPISVQFQVSRSIENGALNLNVLKYRGQRSWQIQLA